jgi:hypothetical protein
MHLSTHEQYLLDFAREEFGEKLTDFLLVGLGEDVVAQSWYLFITYAGGNGAPLKQHVEVITYEPLDGTSHLPRQRDPFVLIALLRLLLRGGSSSTNRIQYRPEEVLNLLGWDDTSESHVEVDEAIRRYCLLSYKWEMNESALADRKLSGYAVNERMIEETQMFEEQAEGSEKVERLHRIVFSEHFIKQLLSRFLFEIDWKRVWSVKPS